MKEEIYLRILNKLEQENKPLTKKNIDKTYKEHLEFERYNNRF